MRRGAVVFFVLWCVSLWGLVWGPSAMAQQGGAEILQRVTVRVLARNVHTGEITQCLGFVWNSVFAWNSAVAWNSARDVPDTPTQVITAAHCLTEIVTAPLRRWSSLREMGETVRVYSPAGVPRDPLRIRVDTGADIAVLDMEGLLDMFFNPPGWAPWAPVGWIDLAPRDPSFDPSRYPALWFLQYEMIVPDADGWPVLSVLSTGGGPPVLSSGIAFSDCSVAAPCDRIMVLLPTAPGTSGALVIDPTGRMVGMVLAEATFIRGGAGFAAYLAPAADVVVMAAGTCLHIDSCVFITP